MCQVSVIANCTIYDAPVTYVCQRTATDGAYEFGIGYGATSQLYVYHPASGRIVHTNTRGESVIVSLRDVIFDVLDCVAACNAPCDVTICGESCNDDIAPDHNDTGATDTDSSVDNVITTESETPMRVSFTSRALGRIAANGIVFALHMVLYIRLYCILYAMIAFYVPAIYPAVLIVGAAYGALVLYNVARDGIALALQGIIGIARGVLSFGRMGAF